MATVMAWMAGDEMNHKSFIACLRADERGTSSIEMGLICALIVLAMLGALKGFAESSVGMWNKINTASSDAISGSTA